MLNYSKIYTSKRIQQKFLTNITDPISTKVTLFNKTFLITLTNVDSIITNI